jgi:hypothetical protein
MSIKLTNVAKVPLTLQLAQRFRDMKPLKGERRLKRSRMNFFRAALRTGIFRDVTWAECTIGTDHTSNRGDGQHTSNVLCELEEEKFPEGLSAMVMTYHLDDEVNDAAQFFELFNNPISARSADDRMHQYRSRYPVLEQQDIPEAFLTKVAKIIAEYRNEANTEGDDQSDWLTVYPTRERGLYFGDAKCREYALWLYQWHSTKNFVTLLKLDPVLLVDSYIHWQEQPDEATVLWAEVFQQTNPDPDAISAKIISGLKRTASNSLQKRKQIEKARRSIKALWAEFLEQQEGGETAAAAD